METISLLVLVTKGTRKTHSQLGPISSKNEKYQICNFVRYVGVLMLCLAYSFFSKILTFSKTMKELSAMK